MSETNRLAGRFDRKDLLDASAEEGAVPGALEALQQRSNESDNVEKNTRTRNKRKRTKRKRKKKDDMKLDNQANAGFSRSGGKFDVSGMLGAMSDDEEIDAANVDDIPLPLAVRKNESPIRKSVSKNEFIKAAEKAEIEGNPKYRRSFFGRLPSFSKKYTGMPAFPPPQDQDDESILMAKAKTMNGALKSMELQAKLQAKKQRQELKRMRKLKKKRDEKFFRIVSSILIMVIFLSIMAAGVYFAMSRANSFTSSVRGAVVDTGTALGNS